MNPQSLVEPKKQKSTKKHSDATIRIQATAELQKLVLAWMKDSTGPRRNRSVFARKAEVANSTIQRLMNDDVFPSTDNLIKMLHVLFASDDLSAIKTKLEQHHSELYTYIKNIPVFAKIPKKSSYSASTPESAEDKQLKIDVIRELREMISEFMRNNPDYSTIPTFARKAQVTDSTIRRIMSPGGGSIPAQANLMRILLILTGYSNTRDAVLFFISRGSPIGLYLKKYTCFYTYAVDVPIGLSMEGLNSPTLPNNHNCYIAYSLVSSRGRARYIEVVQKMGDNGHVAIDRLIKLGLLKMESDGHLTLTNAVPVLTKQTGLDMGKALVAAYANAEASESNISLVINSVNEQGLGALKNLQREYINEVSKIMNTHKGIHRVYVFSVCDSMEYRKATMLDGGYNE